MHIPRQPGKKTFTILETPLTNRVEEDDDFVEDMYDSCPEFREIEFRMCYQFKSHHWIEMMETYGPQLKSLSIWGSVTAFSSKAFITLIGPPVNYLSRNRLHALTLNINGMEHLHECAFIALFLLPHLKEFRARDVPLDAKSLIEEDWICQELEVLEIFVMIPKRTRWRWDNGHGWGKGFEGYRHHMGADWEDASNEDEDDGEGETLKPSKRRVKYITEEARKKARQDSVKYNRIRVMVCETLGRLTHLSFGSRVKGISSLANVIGAAWN